MRDLMPVPEESAGFVGYQREFQNIHEQRLDENDFQSRAVDDLGRELRSEFDECKARREPYEEGWIEDLQQYKGQYDEEVLERLDEQPNRSQAFMRLSKVKVDSITARVMDLIFPASGERNYAIDCSPSPRVPEELLQARIQEMVQAGENPEEIKPADVAYTIAKEAARLMDQEIADQLVERPGRKSYRQVCNSVVKSAVTYGTGVLKGPLVEYDTSYRWSPGGGPGSWGVASPTERVLRPYKEFVPIWSFYPDMDAVDIESARFVWQEHLMTRHELESLHSRPHFMMDRIISHIRDNPDGDATVRNYEVQLRAMSPDTAGSTLKGRYRVLERWGYVAGSKLHEAGYPIPEERRDFELPVNVWLMGDQVIRLVPWPMPDLPIPYHVYYYSKDESSIFGEGVCSVARHPQRAINAGVRAMLDNASISSGPMIGINSAALQPGEDPEDIHGWKVFMFDSAQDMKECLAVYDLPNYSNNYLQLIQYMSTMMDEITTPRFMHGDGKVKGAGETAAGLSMLMGAANITIKDLIKNFDDYVTRPFITSMYHWNMRFNERQEIKGDFEVVARGSTTLMAREVQSEKLMQAMNIVQGTRFAGWLKDHEVLQELFISLDISPQKVRTPEEYEAWMSEQMTREAASRAKANLEVLLNEVQSRGINPDEALKQMLGEAMMQQSGARGGPAGAGQPGTAGQAAPGEARQPDSPRQGM